ncbi:predicted protein [Plenodomus lingam JN3]|uniref:Predicted protein n=1 Tax=Leptosphaeria maculans (strain JN3 / isolate v23.1.3 / race Av1-4-5-6-7-8) TaxID=985895 RepID=E4ZN47_LEPMJ|nr:predicted protein [Plenodomus lingam JN3]CBX92650.1 predicted protein [Plenodomus lingam JN3]
MLASRYGLSKAYPLLTGSRLLVHWQSMSKLCDGVSAARHSWTDCLGFGAPALFFIGYWERFGQQLE